MFSVDSMLNFKDFSRKLSISPRLFFGGGTCMIQYCQVHVPRRWSSCAPRDKWYTGTSEACRCGGWKADLVNGVMWSKTARQEWCNHFPERQHDMFSLRQELRNKSSSKSANELRMSSLKVHPAKISKWMVTLLDVHSFFDKIFWVEEFETSYLMGIGRDFEAGKWMMDLLLWQRMCGHCPLLHLEPRESELGKGARWSKNIKHVDGLSWKCT